MDDADKIIFENLKQVGCDFEVESLQDFEADMTLEAVVKCLKVIINDFSAPTSVPHNMVARYNIGMKLADAIIGLGFKGDLGYQSFLYSNEAELRRIFTFLIEKLPKEGDKVSPTVVASGYSFGRSFAAALKQENDRFWLPHYARDDSTQIEFSTVPIKNAQELSHVKQKNVFISTILSTNASLRAKLASPSAEEFSKLIEVLQEKKVSPTLVKESSMPEDIQDVAEADQIESASPEDTEEKPDEIEILTEKNVQLEEDMEVIDKELERLNYELESYETKVNELRSVLKEELQSNKIRLKAGEIMEEHGPEGAIRFCEEYLEGVKAKSMKLAQEWEKHREPLIEELRDLKHDNNAQFSKQRAKRERLLRLENQRQKMIHDHSFKKEHLKQLQHEWEKLSSKEKAPTQRRAYLHRINEIVASVAKQKKEIEKILVDSRRQQREMNTLAEKLDRTFTAAEQLFAKQAAKGEEGRKAHRWLVDIHKDSKSIFEAVEVTGSMQREIRDLEERKEKELESKVVENLTRITADYNQMKMENDNIELKIAVKGSQSKAKLMMEQQSQSVESTNDPQYLN